ncbi:hypothetical protein J6590_051813 [Homalodisca vitripennis]|nr:hypothetical protein J6590_051813 [Homalodisca vitripennis]
MDAAYLETVGGGASGRRRVHGLPQESPLPPTHQVRLFDNERVSFTLVALEQLSLQLLIGDHNSVNGAAAAAAVLWGWPAPSF